MTYKLTIDSNLMDDSLKVEGMDMLKRWRDEGKIDLTEADRPKLNRDPVSGWPGAPMKTMGHRARPGKIVDSGKATFNSIAAVLFPYKDPHKLSMGEINDVAHLIKHHSSKNEIFVTANLKAFIQDGRRERLKNSFGIVTMTPDETVRMLGEIEGWLEKVPAARKASKSREKT